MSRIAKKLSNLKQRKARIRSVVTGTPERPRLAVHISNLHVSAQIIDDTTQKTLVAATTVGKKDVKGSLTERAQLIGEEIGKKAKTAKIKAVSYDRGGKAYHGRVKALADAARKAGLEF